MKQTKRGKPLTTNDDKKQPFQTMLKPDIAEKVKALAETQNRSVSNTIAYLIESHGEIKEASNGR